MFGTKLIDGIPDEGAVRPRLLVSAYHYDRDFSMESRLSWQRAQSAARDYDVTVICARGDAAERRGEPAGGVTSVVAPVDRFERWLMSWTVTHYLGYRRWQRRVFALAQQMHRERPFDLVHHVSFCGYREPSEYWRLSTPFVWGPVGGTRPFPLAFLGQLDFRGAVRELCRNVINACQLRFVPRVKRAVDHSAAILAANREIARDLNRAFGVTPIVQLETGVGEIRETPRPLRDLDAAPLRILWSGRLRCWKGLPLLLRGLAQLPAETRYTLRVLGQGKCQKRWQRLAQRLGIERNIEWAGWPEYAEQLPHYDWADVFAFTSLRDTSGTGLLEALAAGAPIIGVDHQGAADIMTRESAILVSVKNPSSAISGFRDAVAALAGDGELLARLSAGALDRARFFKWNRLWQETRAVYEAVRRRGAAVQPAAPPVSASMQNLEPALASVGVAQLVY